MKIHESAVKCPLPKLCHAKPGQCIRVYDEMNPNGSQLFMVCTNEAKGAPSRISTMMGLYEIGAPVFLVDLHTGAAVRMPHLSSRVEIVHDAQVYVGKQLAHNLREQEKDLTAREQLRQAVDAEAKATHQAKEFRDSFPGIMKLWGTYSGQGTINANKVKAGSITTPLMVEMPRSAVLELVAHIRYAVEKCPDMPSMAKEALLKFACATLAA